jgi:hypothetical protein
MIRHVLAAGLAAMMLVAPAAALAQQPAPSDSTSTYSDTMPKRKTAPKKATSKKSTSKKSTSKKSKAGKAHAGKTHKTAKGKKVKKKSAAPAS